MPKQNILNCLNYGNIKFSSSNTFYLPYVIIMSFLLHTKLKYTLPIMLLNIIHTIRKKISQLKSAGGMWRYESRLEFRKEGVTVV